MSKPNEDKIIDSLGIKNPVKRAETRCVLRMIQLQMALKSTAEPADAYVLSTNDGRCLTIMPDKTHALDVGDSPKLWPESKAVIVASRWNRDMPSNDHVAAVYWRDHYKEQIERLKAR